MNPAGKRCGERRLDSLRIASSRRTLNVETVEGSDLIGAVVEDWPCAG